MSLPFGGEDSAHGFKYVWRKLSRDGWCDEAGGAEYQRVYREWLQAGCPTPICDFIRKNANRPAGETQ